MGKYWNCTGGSYERILGESMGVIQDYREIHKRVLRVSLKNIERFLGEYWKNIGSSGRVLGESKESIGILLEVL